MFICLVCRQLNAIEMRRRCANVLEVYLAAQWGCGYGSGWEIGNGMRSWRGIQHGREKVTEKLRKRKRMLAALNAISERVGCCLSVVVQAYYLKPSRRWAWGGAGQGSQSGSVSSVPIRSLFHKQSRLPRRSFNKVCRRLGIKISCELVLIFYLFVFALWLSVFARLLSLLPLPASLLYLFLALYSHSFLLRATSNQFQII